MKFLFVDRVGAKSIWSIIGHIAVRLIQDGHSVIYVNFDDGNQAYTQEVPEGVDFFTVKVRPKKWVGDLIPQHLAFIREFRSLLRRLKPDFVHTNFAVPAIAARWVAAKEKVPWVVSTQHETYGSMSFHYRWGLRATEHLCSAMVYVSHTVARSFGRKAGTMQNTDFKRRPIHAVIPNGIDVKDLRKAVADASPRMKRKLVCAGRMVPIKGQDVLLRAIHLVVPVFPDLKLSLIGGGPEEKRLRELAMKLGLESHVEFTGWLPHYDQVLREMASAELVVVPSMNLPGITLHEGFGLVVAEAVLCGTAFLVSDIPVFHEVLDPFQGRGLFFKEGDPTALAGALKEIFSGKNPLDFPLKPLTAEEESRLSSESMAEGYLRLYRELAPK